MNPKPFKNIATAIAFSPNMEANMHESLRITKMLGEKLYFIHVGEASAAERESLERLLKELPREGVAIELLWEEGDVVEAILKCCETHRINLLIAGAQPREGLLRYYMGSVARRLVRKSSCSILLMTHPNKLQSTCGRVVVNGIDHPKTPNTMGVAIQVANCLHSNEFIVVEEVVPDKEMANVSDDAHLEKANAKKEALMQKEKARLEKLLNDLPVAAQMPLSSKIIFGKRGYTIGHFTQTAKADLLVLNSPDTKLGFLDRVFTHDLEYILSELPSDILIVHSHK